MLSRLFRLLSLSLLLLLYSQRFGRCALVKKAGGHIGRNVGNITVKIRTTAAFSSSSKIMMMMIYHYQIMLSSSWLIAHPYQSLLLASSLHDIQYPHRADEYKFLLVCPCICVHKRMSLMSSSLLLLLNCIWWRGTNYGALGNVEYPFIAITPRSTLTRSGSTS